MTFENFAMLLVLAFALSSSTFGQIISGSGFKPWQTVTSQIPTSGGYKQWETVTSSGDGNEQEERVAVTSPGDVIQCACNSTDFEDTILSLQGLLACTYTVLFVIFLNNSRFLHIYFSHLW